MRRNLAAIAVLTAICALSLSCGSSRNAESSIEPGREAPAFELPDLGGSSVSLQQFQGKIVLLDFWATWCGPCRMSMPLLEDLQREYPNDLVLLAVNLQEEPDEVRRYVRQQRLSSRVLLDQEGKVGSAYGSESIPMQVLIDQKGVIRHIELGFSPSLGARLRGEIHRLIGS